MITKMIKALDLANKTKEDIQNFLFKCCPYSDVKLMKFQKLLNDVLSNKDYIHQETLGEATNTSVKYFMVWRNFNNTKMFAGTAFVPNHEIQRGVNLKEYEPTE